MMRFSHMQFASQFNSKYDSWQLGNEFQSKWATKAEQDGVLQYGKDFMAQLAPVYSASETKNGGMITSCIWSVHTPSRPAVHGLTDPPVPCSCAVCAQSRLPVVRPCA